MALPIRLREITPGVEGRTWIGTDTLRVGRREGLEVMLADASVSRLHAEIRPSEQGWQLIDCGSTNGTWLNGARLGAEPRHIRVRDVIQFGQVTMTVECGEDLWLNGNDPFPMLEFLRPRASERKLRLYSAALCNQIACFKWRAIGFPRVDYSNRHNVMTRQWQSKPRDRDKPRELGILSHIVERAEGKISADDLNAHRDDFVSKMSSGWGSKNGWAFYCGRPFEESIFTAAGPDAYIAAETLSRDFVVATAEELAQDQNSRPTWCDLLREIYGNPFRPTTLNPSWITSTVLALAQGIYKENAFDRMPILADALMDADCDNDDILNHCRQPGEHVRGCWVIDLLLAKQ
jgi:hypothetical protein